MGLFVHLCEELGGRHSGLGGEQVYRGSRGGGTISSTSELVRLLGGVGTSLPRQTPHVAQDVLTLRARQAIEDTQRPPSLVSAHPTTPQ